MLHPNELGKSVPDGDPMNVYATVTYPDRGPMSRLLRSTPTVSSNSPVPSPRSLSAVGNLIFTYGAISGRRGFSSRRTYDTLNSTSPRPLSVVEVAGCANLPVDFFRVATPPPVTTTFWLFW